MFTLWVRLSAQLPEPNNICCGPVGPKGSYPLPVGSRQGAEGLTVTPSVCQGLQPNGLALEGLIFLHPGCIKRNLGTDEKLSLHPRLPDWLQSHLKHTTANLPCSGTHGAAFHLCSPVPSSNLQLLLFGAQRIYDKKLKSKGCSFENNVGWPCHILRKACTGDLPLGLCRQDFNKSQLMVYIPERGGKTHHSIINRETASALILYTAPSLAFLDVALGQTPSESPGSSTGASHHPLYPHLTNKTPGDLFAHWRVSLTSSCR